MIPGDVGFVPKQRQRRQSNDQAQQRRAPMSYGAQKRIVPRRLLQRRDHLQPAVREREPSLLALLHPGRDVIHGDRAWEPGARVWPCAVIDRNPRCVDNAGRECDTKVMFPVVPSGHDQLARPRRSYFPLLTCQPHPRNRSSSKIPAPTTCQIMIPPPPLDVGAGACGEAGGVFDLSLCSGLPCVERVQTLWHVQHSHVAPSLEPLGKRIFRPQSHRPAR